MNQHLPKVTPAGGRTIYDAHQGTQNKRSPAIGIGLMIFYGVCDTSGSSLQGTFFSLDMKVIGILYMPILLALTLPRIDEGVRPFTLAA
jgi:hypothetical protein